MKIKMASMEKVYEKNRCKWCLNSIEHEETCNRIKCIHKDKIELIEKLEKSIKKIKCR